MTAAASATSVAAFSVSCRLITLKSTQGTNAM